jgi:hypothetical protein
MANRIFLQIVGTDPILDIPLIEDVTFEVTSNFSSWGELAGPLNTAAELGRRVTAGAGSIRSNVLKGLNLFDVPRWVGTDPIKFTTKLAFYTQEDPKADVFDKMAYMMSLSMLTKNKDGTYTVPGVGARNISEMLGQGGTTGRSLYADVKTSGGPTKTIPDETDFSYKSKIITLEIPGVIYLDYAYITTCTPMISKQKTESGYPLWGNLDVTFSGLYPANSKIFENTETAVDIAQRTGAVSVSPSENVY